ncbi:MAG: RNase adapter RapZ [Deltaproteobacteria bacterium]|nr:RNase adapter RapZ [Deltaproteobacteria bacterium]
MRNLRVVIITGLSGSGKSTVLKAMEDIGFFCVDNLPIVLLPKFLEICSATWSEIAKIALVMDMRQPSFIEKHVQVISKLNRKGYRIEFLFLEASDEILLQRFSVTRRSHPLSEERTIIKSIQLEREILGSLKEMASDVIDTSLYNIHQLKEITQQRYHARLKSSKIIINLTSFGYKYGIPHDADIVMDVRFLPNPYFIKHLKDFDGNDQKVEEYILQWDETNEFLAELYRLISFLTPLYEKEGKAYLNIALGCTGGRHRSVVVLNKLKEHLSEKEFQVNINHRDIDRK